MILKRHHRGQHWNNLFVIQSIRFKKHHIVVLLKMAESEVYSLAFNDSTMFSFLILLENIRFTSIDRENVIAADNTRFEMVNEGIT